MGVITCVVVCKFVQKSSKTYILIQPPVICRREFCYLCGVDEELVLRTDNSAHDESCRYWAPAPARDLDEEANSDEEDDEDDDNDHQQESEDDDEDEDYENDESDDNDVDA